MLWLSVVYTRHVEFLFWSASDLQKWVHTPDSTIPQSNISQLSYCRLTLMWKMASEDWKSIAIRQNFIDTMYCSKNLMLWKSVYFMLKQLSNKLSVFNSSEEAIRQWGNPTTRTASEMEIYSFERANTKVNYLQPYIFVISNNSKANVQSSQLQIWNESITSLM